MAAPQRHKMVRKTPYDEPTAAPPRLFPDRIADRYRNYPDHDYDRAAPLESRAYVLAGNGGHRRHPDAPHRASAVLLAVRQGCPPPDGTRPASQWRAGAGSRRPD